MQDCKAPRKEPAADNGNPSLGKSSLNGSLPLSGPSPQAVINDTIQDTNVGSARDISSGNVAFTLGFNAIGDNPGDLRLGFGLMLGLVVFLSWDIRNTVASLEQSISDLQKNVRRTDMQICQSTTTFSNLLLLLCVIYFLFKVQRRLYN